jgi:hypothetical protein
MLLRTAMDNLKATGRRIVLQNIYTVYSHQPKIKLVIISGEG